MRIWQSLGSDSSATAITIGNSALGEILTDAAGMTLYISDNDTPGQSFCHKHCAENWHPALANPDTKAAGDFMLIKRNDGPSQWAYQGKPLYRWVGDRKTGDTTGDGIGGVWHVARPWETPVLLDW